MKAGSSSRNPGRTVTADQTKTDRTTICFRTVALGHGVDSYTDDTRPTAPPEKLKSCEECRRNLATAKPCPGDHTSWRAWTRDETADALELLKPHSPFLSKPSHASFYSELLKAVKASKILA